MSAASWSQFRADSAGQGSRFVNTLNSLKPAWSLDVGHVVFSSPVVGSDGTIYVGNVEGELIAVNPDGTEKWRFDSGVPILASPAVADDGFIYVLGTAMFPEATPPDHTLRCQLATVSKTGEQHQSRKIPDQGITTGSPKLFTVGGATFVALHARTRFDGGLFRPSALFVYDEQITLLARRDLGCGDPDIVVGEGPDIFGAIKNFFKRLIEFDSSARLEPVPLDVFGELDPSVAVAHRPDLGPPEQPFIVVADRACATISAFRWRQPDIIAVWQRNLTNDNRPLLLTSPAILNNASLVVIGTRNGQVMAFDLATGAQRWVTDIGEALLATPASLDELIFVASSKSVHALNPITGAKVRQHLLKERLLLAASPAVSKNHVHVQTLQEISTLALDFSSTGHDDEGFGGTSSPAIGANGAVYAVVQPGDPKQLERDIPSKLVSYPAPKPQIPGLPNIPSPDQPIEDVP
jgi:outer membrane protein assembly factor BamB